VQAVKLEVERRAREDKPVAAGQPPHPSTSRTAACGLGFIYDFIFNDMTPEQRRLIHDELVLLSAWSDNYGTFNNAEASRSNWATFSYWVFDLMAIEGEPGFNDLKFLGLYRGWRDFYTYSFFDSGAAYEAEGKLLLGLDAAVAMDRVGKKYGLEPLTHHPLPRAWYSKFSALAMLPTRDRFAVFDILGTMGGGFTTPQDLVVAHYLYPNDKTVDFVYRALVGDDYKTLPSSLHSLSHQALTSAIFATAYTPEIAPEKLNVPLTFFCGQRALMMTRSSWDRDAIMLTMHVRGASGGHPYPDRNGIMLSAMGRTWVTIPNKDIGSWAMDTVLIDGAGQNPTTPARVVDFTDGPLASFLTGDAKYCWDWVWKTVTKNLQGGEIHRDDVLSNNVETGRGWELVNQTFNDFAWTKSDREIYQKPLKFNSSWIGIDGVLTPVVRQPNTPVLRSFRSAGLVRGPRPYVLVVDDVQRDSTACRYDWNLSLPDDICELSQPKSPGGENDIILIGKNSVATDGSPKMGEPALLVRVLEAAGTRLPHVFENRDRLNFLSIRTHASAPNFKVMLHAYRIGEPLPSTKWDKTGKNLAVSFPGQIDNVLFKPTETGRNHLEIMRGKSVIASLKRPDEPFNDPATEVLNAQLRDIPRVLSAMKKNRFDPLKLPSFNAGWRFEQTVNGGYAPLTGGSPEAKPIPMGSSSPVDGPGHYRAAATGLEGLSAPLDFVSKPDGPFTVSMWVKTMSDPQMGVLADFGGNTGLTMDIVQGGLRFSTCGNWGFAALPTSMLSSWVHFAITSDQQIMRLYRNGLLIVTADIKGKRFAWGKTFRLGGSNSYGDAATEVGELLFYKTALSPDDIVAIHLHGRQ
jgi:hypothetical protein